MGRNLKSTPAVSGEFGNFTTANVAMISGKQLPLLPWTTGSRSWTPLNVVSPDDFFPSTNQPGSNSRSARCTLITGRQRRVHEPKPVRSHPPFRDSAFIFAGSRRLTVKASARQFRCLAGITQPRGSFPRPGTEVFRRASPARRNGTTSSPTGNTPLPTAAFLAPVLPREIATSGGTETGWRHGPYMSTTNHPAWGGRGHTALQPCSQFRNLQGRLRCLAHPGSETRLDLLEAGSAESASFRTRTSLDQEFRLSWYTKSARQQRLLKFEHECSGPLS